MAEVTRPLEEVGEDRNVTVSRKLVIDAGSEITLEAGDARIEMKDGSITLSGTNISLSANAQMSLEGSAGAELKAGGTLVLKGSLVQIN